MINTMVQRIARAVHPIAWSALAEETWDNAALKSERDQSLKEARAALRVMREPGIAIRKLTSFEFAEVEWPKLIAAALSEKQRKGT